mgnify:CR=1 FL=1
MRKNILEILIIIFSTIVLIFSYQSGSNVSADNGYVKVDTIEGEIYYNESINHIKLSNDRLNINDDVIPTYYSTEKELVSIFVSDLDIEDPAFNVTEKEREILYKITEAEATGGDIESKKNICSTILNRVNSSSFPDDIKSVVFQKTNGVYQFSPLGDNRYYELEITDETIQAVNEVLLEGTTHDCLYFFGIKDVKSPSIKRWIKNKLVFEFEDSVGHSYYNEKWGDTLIEIVPDNYSIYEAYERRIERIKRIERVRKIQEEMESDNTYYEESKERSTKWNI